MLKSFFVRYSLSTQGATAVEYGLIVAGISLAIVSVVFLFGDGLQDLFAALGPALDSAQAEVETSR